MNTLGLSTKQAVLIQMEEKIWQITEPELKRLIADIAKVTPGMILHDVIRMEDYAMATEIDPESDPEIAFDFDEEFDPFDALEKLGGGQ